MSTPAILRSFRAAAALALAVLAAPAASAHQVEEAQPQGTVTIGVIGDQTFSVDLQASYAVLEQGVQALAAEDLDLVLHTGDLIESSGSPAEVTALFDQATAILDQLPVPWFLTAGDHDVNPPLFQQDSADRSREDLFQQLYGQRVPAFAQQPFYSFDFGGFHFVALYSHQALHADPRFGNIFLAQVYEDQLAWLAADLDANQDAHGIVVFLHQPLWYHWSGWQPVHELLAKHRVALVLSGHHHYDQDNGTIDGVRYLTVGATGGFTKNGSRDAGDVQHVTVLRLAGRKVQDLELIALSDGLPLELTPRSDMDRVQALDVQLGNFFDFAQRNPVFVDDDGQLVDACDGGQPATVEITQIGAPIDLPVEVTLGFTSTPPTVVLDDPAFTAGQCQSTVGNLHCVLARTARTFFSNYSSVLIDEFFSPPLWSTGLAPANGVQPGTVLSFDVRTAFDGDSGPLFLETTVSTTVQACP